MDSELVSRYWPSEPTTCVCLPSSRDVEPKLAHAMHRIGLLEYNTCSFLREFSPFTLFVYMARNQARLYVSLAPIFYNTVQLFTVHRVTLEIASKLVVDWLAEVISLFFLFKVQTKNHDWSLKKKFASLGLSNYSLSQWYQDATKRKSRTRWNWAATGRFVPELFY